MAAKGEAMMQNIEGGSGAVAEIQGLYGPFTFPEKLLQQIWLRGDFDQARAMTADGDQVRVIHPGCWNHLGGPDFKDARLKIGGTETIGDIEVHLRAADWVAHGHATDPAYDNVVLHVVLFPTQELVTLGAAGKTIPLLALLPLLNHDLEEYAADEAIERLADHPLAQVRRELTSMTAEKLTAVLLRSAEVRWRQKVHYAKLRIARLGWDAACHHTALEILGYRFNRAPMLAVAGEWPLAEWSSLGDELAETAFTKFGGRWSKQGVRPANHPWARLHLYARWMAARPEWPRRLVDLAARLPSVVLDEAVLTASVRRAYRWTALADEMAETVFGREVGGTRFNTMVCDGLLPLIAAQVGGEDRLTGVWYAWPVGDVPAKYTRLLRELGAVEKKYRPMSHGVVQGLIGWLLVADQRHEGGHPTTEGGGA
jgi:hypothetical protein